MANEQKKNVLYIDTKGVITVQAVIPVCYAIMITPSAENARVTIKESEGGMIVIDVAIQFNESRYIDFGDLHGIALTKNFEVVTLENVDSVIMYGSWKQPVGAARG